MVESHLLGEVSSSPLKIHRNPKGKPDRLRSIVFFLKGAMLCLFFGGVLVENKDRAFHCFFLFGFAGVIKQNDPLSQFILLV